MQDGCKKSCQSNHKKPEHWHAIPFQVDLDFHEVIAFVV